MAYDRYDTRDAPRDERSRWSGDRDHDRGRDDRGFWDRASDEVASWFGDDDAERRRRQDQMREERERGSSSGRRSDEHSAFGRGWGGDNRSRDRDYDRGYGRDWDRDHSSRSPSDDGFRDRGWERGQGRGYSASDRDYNPSWRRELSNDRDRDRDRGYRPMAGDYGRGSDHESEQFFAASGYGRGEPRLGEDRSNRDFERSQSPYGRDQYRRTSFAGSRDRSGDRDYDPDYRSWRDRHMSELDRDYDDYRRENQSRFGSDFGSWRERRQHKRGLLGEVHEHMEVVGNDDKHVGTVDKVAGDRLILTKSDKDAGGHHHSISCSDIERVDGDKVVLDCSADEAKHRWRDESRDRGLHEREDQGEMGPRNLNRSFEGTYR